ncbi:MAG: TIGR02556 family CRISPR-associated protein [Marinisporobacter sp.]|jgi:CRISPR-associated protein Csh1|nr:TIGR02556 family CRISPR-associated protein [Marinisporobacter sp.]
MLNAVAVIGQNQFEKLKEQGGDILDILVQDVTGGGTYNKGILITVEKNEEFVYKGVDLREYDEEDKKRYFYRAGSSRGADLTPTAKITESSKTFNNKIIKSLQETVSLKEDQFKEEIIQLDKIKSLLEDNADQIIRDIEQQKKSLDKKEQAFLTILVKEHGEEKFVGDYEVFKYKLIEDTLRKYYFSQTYKVISKAENKICSMCLEQKEVNGLASPFPFTTFDKLGYLSGGFQREKSWKNIPICNDCGLALELGKNYLNDHLRFSFLGGISYYIIPKLIDEKDTNRVLKTYKRLKRVEKFEDHQDAYISTEEKIIKKLGEATNKVTLNLMFFEEKQNAFNILANIEDVLPSRLKFIFDEIYKMNTIAMFKQFRIQKEKEIPIFINFRTLNQVISAKGNRKYFLECIYKIFKGDKISYPFLLRFIVEDLFYAYNQEQHDKKDSKGRGFNLTTISNYGLLYLMKKVQVLNYKRKEGATMLESEKNIYNLKDYESKKVMFEEFFKHQLDFFDEPIKKALFLQGYLAQKLINFQAFEKDGRTPFKARLKGLKLKERDIKRLIVEIRGKFDEYDVNYYKQEQSLMSKYIIDCGEKWNISHLEIPFYFALGMNMVHCFITNEKEENKNE